MKHQPTSLLLKVLVVFVCFMICGPLGNASSAALEMPAVERSSNFASSHERDLSSADPSTGEFLSAPPEAVTPTVTGIAPTRSATQKAAGVTPNSSVPTIALRPPALPSATDKASPAKSSTPPSGSPTPAATRTRTATATATLAPANTVASSRDLTQTTTLSPSVVLLPFVSGGGQIGAAAQTTTTLHAEIDIDPLVGGQLSVGNGAFIIRVPAGAFASTHRLIFDRAKPNREQDGKAQFLLTSFSLRALDKQTGKETKQFSKAVSIQVRYDPKWIQGWRASDLTLAYWDDQHKEWIPVASQVDDTHYTVSAQTMHFTDYGLVQGPNIQPYLPNVQSAEPNLFLGAATANYDIEVPPGRNGLAPKLSLSYSSASVDMADEFQTGSFVGMGWSFSSSYIARDLRSSYSTNDDVFTLVMDGAGYDLLRAADGSYHTSQKQYWQISFDMANNRWLVTTNDGTQYQYGYSDASRGKQWVTAVSYVPGYQTLMTYSWWLERVIDTRNNQILYTYRHETSTTNCGGVMAYQSFDDGLYPQTIQYNGAGTTFLTRIDFAYSSRNDVRAVGTNVQCAVPAQTLRLYEIDVKTTDYPSTMQLVRRYDLGYDYSLFPGYWSNKLDPVTGLRYTGRLTLRSIAQKGSSGSTILTTMALTYGANNRLASVNNGIGGAVALDYDPAGPLVFTDSLSPRTVWAWSPDKLAQGTLPNPPVPCQNGGYCVDGSGNTNQYGYFGTGQIAPDTYFNSIPGASYMVDIGVKSDGSCQVLMTLWDGIRSTPLTGWMPIYTESWYDPVRLQPRFVLPHDAAGVEIRLSVNGRCAFFGGTGILYRTYYRVAQRTIIDVQGTSGATSTYAYEGPLMASHLRSEYQFRGHSKVSVTESAADTKTDYYFSQEDQWKAGRILRVDQMNGNGGTTYTRTENEYVSRLAAQSAGCSPDPNQCPNPITYEQSYFVYTSATTRHTFDGQPSPKSVRTAYTPDAYDNTVQTDEYDSSGVLYRTTKHEFSYNTTKWILNKAKRTQVLAGGSTLAAETRYFYDGATVWGTAPTIGNLTRVDGTTDGTNFFTQTTTIYDTYGNPTIVTDGRGNPTTTAYDTTYYIFPITVTSPPPLNTTLVTTNTYNLRMGKIETSTDPNGATTKYEYDEFGRTKFIWTPLDLNQSATVKYEYSLGSPRSMVHVEVRRDAGGAIPADYQQAWWFYDGLGRVIQQQSTGLNGTLILVNTAYNTRGLTWAVSNPYTATGTGGTYRSPVWADQPYIEHLYDPVGREIRTNYPERTIYDLMEYSQWLTTLTDANGHQKKTLADAFGRTIQVQELNQGQTYTTGYAYDTMDRLGVITDNVTNTTSLVYDWLGRKKDMYDPDLGHWQYRYDNAGNLIQQTDARGCTTTLTYDAVNRLTGKTYTGPEACNSGASITYRYDEPNVTSPYGRGRRTSMTDSSGSTTWVYDKQGRVITQTNTIAGAPDSYTTNWTYDAMDRARSMKYPDGETVNMTYNDQMSIKDLMSTAGNYVSRSDYNAANQLKSLTFNNAITTTYTYDLKSLRLTNLQNSRQNLSYAYDKAGNVTTLTDTFRSEVATFAYDGLDRLTSVNMTGGANPYSASWTYNPLGNITQATKNGTPTPYSYGDTAHKHAVTQVGSQTFSYDANGNMRNRAGDVLLYDEENRLQRVTTSGATTVYLYNGDGQRVKREVGDSSGWRTTYYVGNWLEVETQTQFTPTPTRTPLPTNTPTRTRTPTVTPTASSPGTGTMQTQSDFAVGNTLTQAYWRGDQGWTRTVPIVNGAPQWPGASAWGGPISISGMPGSGSMQTQSDFAVGNTLWQAFWRGDQGWSRTVPIVSGVIQWSSASAWAGPFPISGQPGSGTLQATGDYVLGNTIYQDVWRGNQRWSRTVPIVNGAPQWSSASAWSGPTDASILPGSGSLQTESNFAVGNTFWQAFWRGDQGWSRSAPIVNGVIQWGSATPWVYNGYVGGGLGDAYPRASTARTGTAAADGLPLSGTVTKYYYFGTQRVAMRTASGPVTYLYGDHLGSTSLTTNDGGAETARQTYYPFGAVRTTSGTLPTDYTFTGQKLDASAGLMYYGARYYAAEIGRFAQPDSIVPDMYNPQSLNRYSYGLNNPVKYTDPTGHRVCEDAECNKTEPDLPIEQVVQKEGNYSSGEDNDVTTVLNYFSDTLGQDRFDRLTQDAVRGANAANRKLTLRRLRGTQNGPGWFDREGRIDLTDATFDPRGFPNYYYGITTESDSAKLLIGHELAHVLVDGLRREAGIDLAVLYQNNVTVSPIHGGTAPNEDLATAIAIGVLTEHGVRLNQPARYTDEIGRFVRTQALPYLRQGGLLGP